MAGTYNLQGGLLQVNYIENGTGANGANSFFNFTGGTLQAAPAGLHAGSIDLSAVTSACKIDMNGEQANISNLVTSSYTDLNFKTPGVGGELLTVSSITANPGTAITFGAAPVFNANGYCDLIADDTNAATDVSNFQVKGNFYPVVFDSITGDIAVAVPEPGTFALLGKD